MATPASKFDAADFGGFLRLLPKELNGIALRHAVEVRSPTFACQEFYDLAHTHNVAIVYAKTKTSRRSTSIPPISSMRA